jgi:hypothetical protein
LRALRHLEDEMPTNLYLLACPIGMGLMMWFMMRGGQAQKPGSGPATTDSAQLVALQAQLDQLTAQQRDSDDRASTGGHNGMRQPDTEV